MPFLPAVEVPALDASYLRVHRFSPRKTTRLLALLATLLPATLPAAVTNYVWDGNAPTGSGNPRWSNAANWSATNTAPPASTMTGLTNTDITFAGNLKTSPQMNNNYFIRTLNFSPTAAAFTLTSQGGATLSLGTGGINNFSTNRQMILSTLSVSNSQTWNASAGNLNIGGIVNLANANPLTVTGDHTTSVSNVIRGSGSLIKQGEGALILGGNTANTFTGGVTIQDGSVIAAKTNALGGGSLMMLGGTLDIGSLDQNVSSFFVLGGTVQSTTGSLLSSSSYQIQAGNISSRLGGSGGLFKTTTGVATLSAANTYSGGTSVSGGTLLVNNATGSGTGSGNVSVSNGGSLAGTGSISGFVTNASGGSISAGDLVGVLNLNSMVWLGGSTNRWDINDATGGAGIGWDLLDLSGSLTISATSSNKAYIDITSFTLGGLSGLAENFNPTNNYLWTILTAEGGISFIPGEDELSVLELITGSYQNPQGGGHFGIYVSTDGKSLNLIYTPYVPVPEPSALALICLAACGIIYGRRMRNVW